MGMFKVLLENDYRYAIYDKPGDEHRINDYDDEEVDDEVDA